MGPVGIIVQAGGYAFVGGLFVFRVLPGNVVADTVNHILGVIVAGPVVFIGPVPI